MGRVKLQLAAVALLCQQICALAIINVIDDGDAKTSQQAPENGPAPHGGGGGLRGRLQP